MGSLTNSAKLIQKIENLSIDKMSTTQPSNPIAGSTYYDSTSGSLKIYDGTQWNDVGGGGSGSAASGNFLSEKYIVGELYSLSNNVFRQDTPTLSNSTREMELGDTASHKEIHIQRIGSGTESNTIKLKLKKYGDPETNLTVEVREGVQVNASSTDAYWYGSNVICSGTIIPSQVSTNGGEVTITMSGNFGGTKGQLLDVVIYKTSGTASLVNYFTVMFDNTQYSECFSAVYVNGATRSRTKIAPYCLSTGFLTSLMAKVKTEPWSFTESITMTATSGGGGDSTYNVFEAPYTGNYHVRINVYNTNSSGGTSGDLQGYNSLVSGNYTAYAGDYGSVWIDCVINVTAGTMIKIKMTRWSYGSGGWRNATATFERYGDVGIMPSGEGTSYFILKPRTIESLGNDVLCTLYGEHVDGIYEGGVMLKTATTATSGSISTSNYVGYIVVNLNGSLVKIPYYNV